MLGDVVSAGWRGFVPPAGPVYPYTQFFMRTT